MGILGMQDTTDDDWKKYRQNFLDVRRITMTHDELLEKLGEQAEKLINDSGFVLVPKSWREDVMQALSMRVYNAHSR